MRVPPRKEALDVSCERRECAFRSSASLNGVGCASELRGELALTHIAVCVTVIASVFSLGGILLSLVEDVATGRWVSSLGKGFSWRCQLLDLRRFSSTSGPTGPSQPLRQHRRSGRGTSSIGFFHAPQPPRLDHPRAVLQGRSPRSPAGRFCWRPAGLSRPTRRVAD